MEQVLYWNDVVLEANRVSFTDKPEQGGPTLSSRAMAIIHLAMHDAYKGASGTTNFDFFLTNPPALPTSFSSLSAMEKASASQAAIAGAAHTALVALYPQQEETFNIKLNSLTHLIKGKNQGYQYGCDVARAILTLRKDDPNNSDSGYIPHLGRGNHKADPNNEQGYLAPFYGSQSKLFSATVRHALKNTPFTNSAGEFNSNDNQYKRALKQVKVKGIAPELMGTLLSNTGKRTVDETLIGIFWAYDGANKIGTPPRLYNQIIRSVAINNLSLVGYTQKDTQVTFTNLTERNVRLFAMANAALADAGILAWEQKYIHNLWRPVVGIREHDKSMGPTGIANNNINDDCDPLWLPLGAPKSNNDGSKNFTPDFPAYPSGHATFGASSLHMVRLFFSNLFEDRNNDNLFDGCDFVSDEFNGVTRDNNNTVRPCHVRNFPGGIWQMILENGLSRIFLGVHWAFDAFKTDDNNQFEFDKQIGGGDLGLTIAEDIFKNGLKYTGV